MALADERIAVVGATGAVGLEMLRLLGDAGVPAERITALASARSAGSQTPYAGGSLDVHPLDDCDPGAFTLALLAASGTVSRQWGPRLAEGGALVVDNSSAFRMDPAVALVVPEVNGDLIRSDRSSRIIANPNCSTIILLVAVEPLRRTFGCDRLIVSTYQAVSGAGLAAMRELEDQARAVLDGHPAKPEVFSEPCAFNVFSHDSAVDPETGSNVEEQKMIDETRKIWNDPGVAVCATCVRVPVMRTHCESVHITLSEPATERAVRERLDGCGFLEILDDRAGNRFPTSLGAASRGPVQVGRIRPDVSTAEGDGYRGWQLWIAGDQILKGAALNALQIAELALA